MSEKIFTNGMIIKAPREGAPDFVKGAISIKTEDFMAFLKEHTKPDGWVNIDIQESKDGQKWYGQLNTWSKDKQTETADSGIEYPAEEIDESDIPFS